MKNKTPLLKKTLALLLALTLILPAANVFVSAAETSVTAGELVANNYDSLADKEKAILSSGLVIGGVYTVQAPDGSDNTVTVDPDEKTVEAVSIVKDGFTWTADFAKAVYDGGSEDITLTESGDTASGTFTYDGNLYSVDVTYKRPLQVDTGVQAVLLNGPYYYLKALSNIEYLDANQMRFTYISSTYKSSIRSLTDGTLPDGAVITTPATVAAVNSLIGQIDDNIANDKGSFLDVELMLFEFEYADSASQYLFEHGAEMKAKVIETYGCVNTICSDTSITDMIDSFGNRPPNAIRTLKKAMTALNNLKNVMAEAANDGWAVLQPENDPFISGLSTSDYQLLDSLAAADGDAEYHTDEIMETLDAEAVISVQINRHNVVINVNAEVIAEDCIDSTVTTPLTEYTATVRLNDTAASADVLAAITASGIEAQALSAWGDISEENYDREVTGVIPDTLTEDITYTVSYTPKTYDITYGFTTNLPASVPYGYNMTLPSRGTAALVYDYYTTDGEHYFQGDIIRITGSTSLTRTEGKPWSAVSKNGAIAEVYEDVLSEEEYAVLGSDAFNNDKLRIRVPTNADNIVNVSLISDNDYEVTADNYPSGITGLEWIPVTGVAVASDGTDIAGTEFTVTNNTAYFTADEQIGVRIRYELAADTLISSAEVLSALNLPKTLADEAKDQMDNMRILDDLYDDLAKLNTTTLNRIKIGVNGSDMGQEARDAVATIIADCRNPRTDRLYLYEYLTQYRADGLAYYYRDGNYEKIQAQVDILNANLSTIYNDSGFRPLLIELEYDGYYEMIGDIINDLSSVTAAAPNAAIDTASPTLSTLASAIESMIDQTHTYGSADRDVVIGTTVNACTYRVVFKADGVTVATVEYEYGAASISAPAVPQKEGFLADWESYTLNVTAETVVNAVYVYGKCSAGLSLSLENEILINCYIYGLKLPAGSTPADCRIVYTFNGQTNEVPMSSANALSGTSASNKLVIAKCAAKEIADIVTVQIYNNDNLITEKEYSIKKYCDAVIASSSTAPVMLSLKELCKYVLDYGSAAQIRFNHNADHLANGGEFYNNGRYFDGDTLIDLSSDYYIVQKIGDNIAMGASLSLEYETEINIYFSNAYTYEAVTVDGVDVLAEVTNVGGGFNLIVIRGTAAKELDKAYTVYLKTTTELECTLLYSALSYAYKNRNDERESQVCKALFNYYLAAKAYFDVTHP